MGNDSIKKIRVLVVSSKYPPEYAGSGLRAHRTYLRLREKFGIEFETLCSSLLYFKWRTEQYNIDGVSVTRISSPFKRFMLKAEKSGKLWAKRFWYVLSGIDECLRTIMFLFKKRNNFDVVHTFGSSWSGGIAKIWTGLNKKKLIVEIVNHSGSPDDPAGLRPFVRWAVHRKGLVIAISPLLEGKILDRGYKNIWCRPNPVDGNRFFIDRSKKMHWRSKYTHFSEQDIVLLELSKYIPRKNKELVIKSLLHLPKQYKLVIAGPLEKVDQKLYFKLKGLAHELGLEERVIITHGFIDHPEHYYHMADIFLFPSLADALGTPVFEAICCGVPVVANRINGVTDWWIRDGINGYLCDPTPECFAENIQRAVTITVDTLVGAAGELMKHVSTDVIDKKYYGYLSKT